MERRTDFTITTQDGVLLACYEWPVEQARAVVLIVHGMAEHASRYGRFAKALNAHGFATVSMDLRGHGQTCGSGTKGLLCRKGGWKAVLEDIRQLALWINAMYPGLPIVLFGHSMGSIFARAALHTYGELFHCAVLCGVTVDKPGRREAGPLISFIAGVFYGAAKPSRLLDNLAFSSNNKHFAPSRTAFDWLSRDAAEVDLYVNDDFCGFVCTASMFRDVANVLLVTLKGRNVEKIPKNLPIFIISGTDDPVGDFGQAARFLQNQYEKAGLAVTMKLYEGARHELLNEINRDEVTDDVIGFIEGHIS